MTVRLLAAAGLALASAAAPTAAQTRQRNSVWVRLGANLPQRVLANRPSAPQTNLPRVRMADGFAAGASLARAPAPGGLLGWRATVLIVPTVHLHGAFDSLEPGAVFDVRWGTAYYLSAEALPRRSLGRMTLYGIVGGGMRIVTTPEASCIPEDLACNLGVAAPETLAGLVSAGGGSSLTLGAYTFGAEAVSQLSPNRGHLQHDLAVLATLRILAW